MSSTQSCTRRMEMVIGPSGIHDDCITYSRGSPAHKAHVSLFLFSERRGNEREVGNRYSVAEKITVYSAIVPSRCLLRFWDKIDV